MSENIEPWWARGWCDWWANQKTTLLLEDPDGKFEYDAVRHEILWRGLIAAIGGKWAISIRWGPGTPFFPPLISPVGYYSQQHQLRDGSLCLAPPSFTEVMEISDWLKQARILLDSYVREHWAISKEDWQVVSLFRPEPGYRLHERPHSYLLIPGDWVPPCEQGELVASLPRKAGGLGVMLRWRAIGQQEWEEFDSVASYVQADGGEVHGFWLIDKPGGSSECTDLLGKLVRRRKKRTFLAFRTAELDGAANWDLILYDPEALAELTSEWRDRTRKKSAEGGLVELTGSILQQSIIRGLSMRSGELTTRAQLSRSSENDAKIRTACVVLVGLGALGSEVAHLLAKEQVGEFILIDGDLLLPGNIARHRLGLNSVGGNKAEKMKAYVEQHNPGATVSIVPLMLDEGLPALKIPDHALLIGMTGHVPSERVLSSIAEQRRLKCLHAWMECDGQLLRLHQTVPYRDPYLHEVTDLPTVPWLDRKVPLAECADNVLPGSASSLHAAANLVARTVLDLLCERRSSHNHHLFAPDGLNEDIEGIPVSLRHRYGFWSSKLERTHQPPLSNQQVLLP